MNLKITFFSKMEALLDFSQPFNYPLFAQVVEAYQQTKDYSLKQQAADVLRQFQDSPQSSQLCMNILSQEHSTQTPMVRFFGFSLLETFIRRNWYIIPTEQQQELCSYIMSFASQTLSVDDVVRRKYLTIFTLIALHTYPSSYSTFLSDVLSMRSTPLDRINSVTILTSFFEDFRVRDELLSGQKQAIHKQLSSEISKILSYLLDLLRDACAQKDMFLLCLLMKLLIAVVSFCDNPIKVDQLLPFIDSLLEYCLQILSFGSQEAYFLSLQALGHMYATLRSQPDTLVLKLSMFFYTVWDVISQSYKPKVEACTAGSSHTPPGVDPGLSPVSYSIVLSPPIHASHGNIDQQPTLTGEALFSLSFFLRNVVNSCLDQVEKLASNSIPPDSIDVNICLRQVASKRIGSEKLLDLPLFKYRSALQLLMAILVFQKTHFDIVDTQLIEFFSSLAKKAQSCNTSNPAFKRMELYIDIFTAVQRFVIVNMPPPIEVLVYVDEYGNVLKRELEDSEKLNMFSIMSKAIEATTRAIKTSVAIKDLLSDLSKQFSVPAVNSIAWSLPSVARSIKSPDTLIISTINHLVDFSSILVSMEHKICIASGIVYICSQMPLFVDTKESIFLVILNKMLYFTGFPNEHLQEMSVRCFALLINNVKGSAFFESAGFRSFLRNIPQIAIQIPSSLIIVLYESISRRISDASSTFMDYVGPLFEMLDGALSQWPPTSIEVLSTISTLYSIFSGICEGVAGKTNGEVFASSYSHFMGRTLKLYAFIYEYILSPSTDSTLYNILCTVRKSISNFLEMLIKASTHNHIRVWFLNTSPGTNVALPDSNSVRSDTLVLLKAYKQLLDPASTAQTGKLDVQFSQFAYALFERIVVLSSDADKDDLINIYFNEVLAPILKCLATSGFAMHADLADVFIESICHIFTICNAYIRRQGSEFLHVFLEFVPPIIRAVSESNLFHKHYSLCFSALTTLADMLMMREPLEINILSVLFVDTIRLLNKSIVSSEYSLLSAWWALLQRTNEPDMETKVFYCISPSITPTMIGYFRNGFLERNEAIIRDLFVVLRTLLWF